MFLIENTHVQGTDIVSTVNMMFDRCYYGEWNTYTWMTCLNNNYVFTVHLDQMCDIDSSMKLE